MAFQNISGKLKKISTAFIFYFCPLQASMEEMKNVHFVWGFGFLAYCNKGLPKTFPYDFDPKDFSIERYKNIQKGDLVWISVHNVHIFTQKILPYLKNPCILLISQTDASFPSEVLLTNIEPFLKDPNIYHVFVQNCDLSYFHPKVTYIPIGIDFHSAAYKSKKTWGESGPPCEQESVLVKILQKLSPTYLRKKRAFVDFQHNDTLKGPRKRYLQFGGEGRIDIFNKIKKQNVCDYDKKMPRAELWKRKGYYAFSISPPGNGLDCHRTWEDLILGCIVIVRHSSIDPLFENLPVVKISSWLEITQKNMEKWIQLYPDVFTNPTYRKKLTQKYWTDLFLQKKQELLEN